jgi:N utilization substance protein B
MPLGPRTKTRARALQILYAWEMHGAPRVVDVASGLVRITGRVPPVLEEAERLAQGVIDQARDLDEHASEATDNWRVERLGAIERNILRIGVYELTTEAAPPKVVINEAVQLAHWFGGLKSPGFVNGVLDRVARSLGRL